MKPTDLRQLVQVQFCTKTSAPERLSLVRSMAEEVVIQDRYQCPADEVDVLWRAYGHQTKSAKMAAIVDCFERSNLKLLTSAGVSIVSVFLPQAYSPFSCLKIFSLPIPGKLCS